MAGIWSAIKSVAPGLATTATQPRIAPTDNDDDGDETLGHAARVEDTQPSSPAPMMADQRDLGTPRPLPSSLSSSRDGKGPQATAHTSDVVTAGTGRDASTPPKSHSHHRTPSRLSRNSSSTGIGLLRGDKGRAKDRDPPPPLNPEPVENADKTGTPTPIPTLTTTTTTTTTTITDTPVHGGGPETPRTAPSPAAHTPGSHSGINPLSQQIYLRKNTEPSIPHRLSQMAEGLTARASSELTRGNALPSPGGEGGKDKDSKSSSSRRPISFLSKLNLRPTRSSSKKDTLSIPDSDSEMGGSIRLLHNNNTTTHMPRRVFSQSSLLSGGGGGGGGGASGTLPGGGYVPRHKEPPRYVRVRASHKKEREFGRMFLAQELVGTRPLEQQQEVAAGVAAAGDVAGGGDGDANASGSAPVPAVAVSVPGDAGGGDGKAASGATATTHTTTGGAIWATEFSKDGQYLATAGRDHVVRVWAVLSTPEERASEEEEGEDESSTLRAPVFRDQPVREFRGHAGEVLDLSWSKNNFLLSSSMDKTVRLWHVSRPECLCTFKHKDFVTRLAFHPRDDRFFLAGSLDTMLRLWSIPDQAVAFSAQLPDLVTAVAFSPDGKVAIAGLLNGMCMFYETEGLKLSSQLHVRSSRGKNAKGSKITGIQTIRIPPHDPLDAQPSEADADSSAHEVRVLITSNDSRIRIYSLNDKTLQVKLKGHENTFSQISATFSDDGRHVICGSEDRKTFIWSLTAGGDNTTMNNNNTLVVQDKDKWPVEYFEAHGDIVTTAIFAPTKTRMLLSQSGDPIYDLCNPPPVILQSLEEAAQASQTHLALTHDSDADPAPPPPPPPPPKRPEPSPAYIARSTHYDGHIIVTTGDTGIIKVFRQDCAYAKRRHETTWETRIGSGYIGGAGLGRSASVLTRTSASASTTAHSRRSSLSQPAAAAVAVGGGGHGHGHGQERILSWRLGIENSSSSGNGIGNGGRGERAATPVGSLRSSSPAAQGSRTSLNSAYNALASEARRQPYAGVSPSAVVRTRDRAGSAATAMTAPVTGSPLATVARAADWDEEFVPMTTTTTVTAGAGSGGSKRQQEPKQLKLKRQDSLSASKKKVLQQQEEKEPMTPPVPGFTFRSVTGEVAPALPSSPPDSPFSSSGVGTAGGNTSFWNLSRWKGIGFRSVSSGSVSGPGGKARRSSGSATPLSPAFGDGNSPTPTPPTATPTPRPQAGDEINAGDSAPTSNANVDNPATNNNSNNNSNNNNNTDKRQTLNTPNRASAARVLHVSDRESDSDVASVPVSGDLEREGVQQELELEGGLGSGRRRAASQGHGHASRLGKAS
ncbi:hypothetical protein VTJ49DRAFT_517 [Mycothermus thermophilus]|uniref:WD repeat-containing protein 44 n=1 Tax=Humicola insolens TaxID=85995 RepID=A0ABR3VH10_HUMIN